ncbi:MAG: zinc-dependent alcohol dehydrogenase [Halobacteriota archaeon]
MEAIVFDDFGELSVETVPDPTVGKDEALVEINRVQLSVTEGMIYHGEASAYFEAIQERLEEGPAQLFGHEFSGRVVEVGDDVTTLSVGDRVYPPGKVSCYDCEYCRRGYYHFCPNKETLGFHRPGGLAEYVSVPEAALCVLPENVSDAEGAAMQPFVSSMLCVHDADLTTGDIVATVGGGVMGNQCGQAALHMGAAEVFVIDIDPNRVALAEEMGMTGIDATEEDAVDRIHAETDSIGADVAFEAVGAEQSHATVGDDPLAQAHRMARRNGTVVQVGILTTDVTLDPHPYRSGMVDWVNPVDMTGTMPLGPNYDAGQMAARLVSDGRVTLEPYVTHELEGLDSVEEAIEITLNKDEYDAMGPAQIVLND